MMSDFDRWNAQIDAWEAKVRALRRELRERYEREPSSALLEAMSAGYEAAWRELCAAFDRVRRPRR